MARQAQWAGGRVSRASEWAELQAFCYGNGKIEHESIYGNDKLMETENVIFT